MMQKHYDLPEETVKKIKEVQMQAGFKYEVDAVIHIISDYTERDKIYRSIDNLTSELNRLRFGVATAETNSSELKDVVNSLLYHIYQSGEAIFIPATGKMRHQLVREAEDRLKEIISNSKQKKDGKAVKGE